MNLESLCKLCSDPAKCPLCDVMRNPRPLTMRTLGAIASGRCAPAPVKSIAIDYDARRKAEREAALRAEIEATKAEIERVKAQGGRANDGRGGFVRVAKLTPVHVPSPAITVPPAQPLPPLAPAPAPLPAPTFGPLKINDWAGLAARVEAGVMTHTEAEGVASEWMTAFHAPIKGGALA